MSQVLYLTTTDLCRRYGVCRRTIVRWASRSELNFPVSVVINKRRYWRADELLAWEAARDGQRA